MKYVKTTLKEFDIQALLKNNTDYDENNDFMKFYARDVLVSRTPIYPNLYFFQDLGGRDFVLVTWHDVSYIYQHFNAVYHIYDYDEDIDKPCETILRDLVCFMFDTDAFNVLPLYGLQVKPPLASYNCRDVRVWVEFDRDPNEFTEYTPFDGYFKDEQTQKPLVFKTYNHAKNWIDSQQSRKVNLLNGQTVKPIYHIVK